VPKASERRDSAFSVTDPPGFRHEGYCIVDDKHHLLTSSAKPREASLYVVQLRSLGCRVSRALIVVRGRRTGINPSDIEGRFRGSSWDSYGSSGNLRVVGARSTSIERDPLRHPAEQIPEDLTRPIWHHPMSGHRSPSPLRFKSVGRGHPLVLLHGFGMLPRTYFPLARLLADRAQVIIPAIFDLPGTWTFPVALWPVSKPPWTLSV
jgi:hypothetical protein